MHVSESVARCESLEGYRCGPDINPKPWHTLVCSVPFTTSQALAMPKPIQTYVPHQTTSRRVSIYYLYVNAPSETQPFNQPRRYIEPHSSNKFFNLNEPYERVTYVTYSLNVMWTVSSNTFVDQCLSFFWVKQYKLWASRPIVKVGALLCAIPSWNLSVGLPTIRIRTTKF